MATKTKSEKKEGSTKNRKITIKRRTSELTPSKASATAIASQAARSRKQNISEIDISNYNRNQKKSATKIPTGIWIFFGCSLLLFCVSIYKALMVPQIATDSQDYNNSSYWISSSNNDSILDNEGTTSEESDIVIGQETNPNFIMDEGNNIVVENKSENSSDVIIKFFSLLSNKDFEEMNDLLYGQIKTSSEIREHFSAFRMEPFLGGIIGNNITPTNIEYVSTSNSGNKSYKFNLSYTLQDDNQQFDEERTITTKYVEDEWKIVSIKCETYRCSFHPIFWPENFGLM